MGEQDDRAAILARRQRFIALAISGLSTGCSPGKPGPTPTTASTSSSTTNNPTSTSDGDGDGEESEDAGEATSPSACLKFDMGSPPKFDMPSEDETSESESGDEPKLDLPPEDESEGSAEGGAETGPRPCLAPPDALPD